MERKCPTLEAKQKGGIHGEKRPSSPFFCEQECTGG